MEVKDVVELSGCANLHFLHLTNPPVDVIVADSGKLSEVLAVVVLKESLTRISSSTHACARPHTYTHTHTTHTHTHTHAHTHIHTYTQM